MDPSLEFRSYEPCCVCGQIGAKFHYGILACDGCKAFFRRTVRLNLQYACRRGDSCSFDHSKRNVCRACRFTKCLNEGMRLDAVQKPRDLIAKHRAYRTTTGATDKSSTFAKKETIQSPIQSVELAFPNGSLAFQQQQATETPEEILSKFMHDDQFFADMSMADLAAFVSKNFSAFVAASGQVSQYEGQFGQCKRQVAENSLGGLGFVPATLEDCVFSTVAEIRDRIAFLRSLRFFKTMTLKDRVALFRSNFLEYYMICMVRRSLPFNDLIVLADEKHAIPRGQSDTISIVPGFSQLEAVVLDDLIVTYRELECDSVEYNCLQAISFFEPEVVTGATKILLRKKQHCFLVSLEQYINSKPVKHPGRYGTLLALLKRIQSVGQKFFELVRLSTVFDHSPHEPLMDDVFKGPYEAWGPLGEALSFDGTDNAVICAEITQSSVNSPHKQQQQPQIVATDNHQTENLSFAPTSAAMLNTRKAPPSTLPEYRANFQGSFAGWPQSNSPSVI